MLYPKWIDILTIVINKRIPIQIDNGEIKKLFLNVNKFYTFDIGAYSVQMVGGKCIALGSYI